MIESSEITRQKIAFRDQNVAKFRDYTINPKDEIKERVRKTYFEMHKNMTVDLVKGKKITKTFKLLNIS